MLGYHQSFSNPMTDIIRELNGRETFQVFTRNARNLRQRFISSNEIDAFNVLLLRSGVKSYVIHAPYIMNPASPNTSKRNRAKEIIQSDMDFLYQLAGKKYYVLHPGSHMGCGVRDGIKNLAGVLSEIETYGVEVCVEFMAGGGTEIVCTDAQLEIARVLLKTKFTFDSAHVWQAGYSPLAFYNRYKDLFSVVHLNNSTTLQGSHHDVHANIEYGTICPNLLKELYASIPQDVPVILETPYSNIYNDYKYLKS